MFNTLYLLNYNNYYNRLVKYEETLSNYLPYVVATVAATNFNPNDNIYTEHIVNIEDDITPDYAILLNTNGEIVSRWFIIESNRIRGGQYRLTLYRDTIVDYLNVILEAPCFVEKATLNIDNPLIFNSENMTFNQIKKNEALLKDKSNCAWLVGYYDKTTDTTIAGQVKTNLSTDVPYRQIDTSIENFYPTPVKGPAYNDTYDFYFTSHWGGLRSYNYFAQINAKTGTISINRTTDSSIIPTIVYGGSAKDSNELAAQLVSQIQSVGINNLNPVPYSGTSSKSYIDTLLSYNGQTIRDTNQNIYDISFKTTVKTEKISISSGALYNQLIAILINVRLLSSETTPFTYTFTATTYTKGFSQTPFYTLNYDVTGRASRIFTEDAPYNLFAIPYGQLSVYNASNELLLTTEAKVGLDLISGMALNEGTKIYDIQLLPYCPIPELITDMGEITVTNANQYSIVTDNNSNARTIIFDIPHARFNTNVIHSVSSAESAVEKKVNNECDKWRLCSPNYSNYFDFSVEKNNGIDFFDVDCEYKPYTPYIHINPNFRNLYGADYNDPRGLVCGGDFSLTQVRDAWVQYQIQNKNFQASFDRQIQNMEVTNNAQRTQDIVGAVAGTAQGIATGATLGAMTGMGGVAGGIVGGYTSALAGYTDVLINEQLRNEALDYTKDQFGYNLGNIQALPQTLSKISAFNNNNKIFPVLEYYSCSDIEKEALRNKIKYNGMTAMVIGSIANFQQAEPTYIKGRIIRLENLDDDFHVANTIAKEINLGIYI